MNFVCDTLEDALKLCVGELGGPKVVGHRMRPELSPADAGIWLSHCLTPAHAQKPSLAQVVWILREARAAGHHAGAEALADLLGYRITAIVDAREELADVTRRAVAAAHESAELSNKALALAHAMHLKVEP